MRIKPINVEFANTSAAGRKVIELLFREFADEVRRPPFHGEADQPTSVLEQIHDGLVE